MDQASFDGMPWQAEAPGRLIRLPLADPWPSDLATALQRSRGAEAALAAVLDAVPQAVLLVDDRGRLCHANAAGRALLRQGDGLCLLPGRDGPGQLSATRPSAARRLRLLLGRAATGASGWMRLARPCGAPGRPLLLLPLPGPLVAVLAGGDGVVPAAGTLRDAFGLTAAQAQVLRCIAAGSGVPGTAAALGLSAETVRTHLARCFDATGARSQVALAALVARLPQFSAPG